MELHNVNTDQHGSAVAHPLISVMLYVLSWLFIYLETITADEIWTWIWRGLSAISLLLIIFINWNKAIDIVKKRESGKE